MNNKFTKITFLGDITCDRPLLEASRIKSGIYDFSGVFSKVKFLLEKSDYTIANFETVCAGSVDDYKNEFLLYNCPDQIVNDLKEGGIDFVTTANNHCLDQGVQGLLRTIDILDRTNVRHTGTFTDEKSCHDCAYVMINGIKIAIMSYTYGTNESNTGVVLDESNDYYVGLLRRQVDSANNGKGIRKFIVSHLSARKRRIIKRLINRTKLYLGISYFKPYTDKISKDDMESIYLEKIKKDIKIAKKNSDIVVVCPHMGGQFNVKPGEYSHFLVKFLKNNGVDIIAGNHPHVIQKVSVENDRIAAYSLGGFNLSASADYIVHESLPEYSMALHVYINSMTKKIEKYTFSILKIIEDERKNIVVFPINELPKVEQTKKLYEDINVIYKRITGYSLDKIDLLDEYEFRL